MHTQASILFLLKLFFIFIAPTNNQKNVTLIC